jgi:ankyrin repeat protein
MSCINNLQRNDILLAMNYAIQDGDIDIVRLFLNDKLLVFLDLDVLLRNACNFGQVEIAELLISEGSADFNYCMNIACVNNHVGIVKLFIDNKTIISDINSHLEIVCYKGYTEIISLLVSAYDNCDLNSALISACRGGYIESVKLMVSLGANCLSKGIYNAMKLGYTDIVEFLVIKFGKIPEILTNVTKEQAYIYYKCGVIPSMELRPVFNMLRLIDSDAKLIYKEFLVSDLYETLLSY